MSKFSLEHVSIGLKENSFDFIKKGLDEILSNDEQDYKYAILHLYSGIILFLKDILYKEHWILIFQNVDHANKERLFDGTIKSVNHDTLINRLKRTEKFILSKRFYKDLDWLRGQRNKIEHLHNELNAHEVRSRIAILMNELYDIYHEYKIGSNGTILKSGNIVEEYNEFFELIKKYSFDFDDFIEERLSKINSDIKKCYMVLVCPKCSQKTLEVLPDEQRCICHFCSTSYSTDELYYEYSKHFLEEIKYGYVRPKCLNCNSQKILKNQLDIVCLDCFEFYDYKELTDCGRCGSAMLYKSHNYDTVFCDDCINWIAVQ